MKHINKFKYGQWDVTIEVKSLNGYHINDYRTELFVSVDCTGTWVSTQGAMYFAHDCVKYNNPEILPDKLKEKILKICARKLTYGERYVFTDLDLIP